MHIIVLSINSKLRKSDLNPLQAKAKFDGSVKKSFYILATRNQNLQHDQPLNPGGEGGNVRIAIINISLK